ncbi:Uncharacterized protein TPAR_01898 [Tolypocladium paradoxum]|uniref:Protein kinase domain-containing protein n=1 Tax=Tolypocladium paradoxum TaxID=94208 RepID=A0A2S4L629_9HYPO|nr:Uncharacterized protein TPAR_01898 [Tolypocladium paradoxum]
MNSDRDDLARVRLQVYPSSGALATELPRKTTESYTYGDAVASFEAGAHLLNEAAVCEVLKKHPHPNVIRYFGCVVEDGRIKGLCFVKYQMTLLQRVRDSRPLDVDRCLQGIEERVNHLHGLGLIHNDLNPSNIMMDGDNQSSSTDSCKSEGTRLGPRQVQLDGRLVTLFTQSVRTMSMRCQGYGSFWFNSNVVMRDLHCTPRHQLALSRESAQAAASATPPAPAQS